MLSRDHARRWLIRATALGERLPTGPAGPPALLARLGCIQLDPIDRVGPNAELVGYARLPDLRRGGLHPALEGHAFEHFAKERCLVHARHFAHYRAQAVETPWWRHTERMKRVDEGLLAEVHAEVRELGPTTLDRLTHRGDTDPIDWSGWKSTSSRTSLAAEVLWTRCDLVVAARDARGRRLYDVPERALGAWASAAPEGPFAERMTVERVRSAGLLARAGGPTWSMLSTARTDGTVDRLLADGALVEVQVEGQARPYLALPEVLTFDGAVPDVPPTVLGPLDPLLWDRSLVEAAFGFAYVWEIYKPADQRQWGYYVCPVVHGEHLVGRVEARRDGATLLLENAWPHPGAAWSDDVLDVALTRLARHNGCEGWRAA